MTSGPSSGGPSSHEALAGLSDPLEIQPVHGPLNAVVRLPGSKSITNRALICAALSRGTSTLRGVLHSDDTAAMVGCLEDLGISLTSVGDTVTVVGSAGRVPNAPATLDARQSGTTARFMLALAALAEAEITIDGHAQLRARPMRDGIDAVRALGCSVADSGGCLPVTVGPGPGPSAAAASASSGSSESTMSERSLVRVRGDVSSQFLTGLLLAAPCVPGGLSVEVDGHLQSVPYVAMTVAVMAAFGASVEVGANFGRFEVADTGYSACDYPIEPDASAASYPLAAAALCGGTVVVEGLGAASVQGDVRFAEVLAAYGAEVTIEPDRITVRGAALRGGTFDLADISDTAQTLAAIAPFAEAPTEILGIGFIRRKETDRVAAMVGELRRLGIDARELDDGLRIVPGPLKPAVVQTYDDHRMAMSFALVGLRADGVSIADPGCVAKTFPTYWRMLAQLAASAEERS